MEASLTSLEQQRELLERNVAQLQKSLQYWQTWEAEYEGLREEIQRVGKRATNTDLDEIRMNFDGELLNLKETKDLFEDTKGQRRGSSQIIGLLSRRIDYVQSNVTSISNSLNAAETKLRTSQALSQSELQDEEGLPLMEIQEELDEDGNIISGRTSLASDAAPQVVNALRTAGVKDLPDLKPNGSLQKASGTKDADSSVTSHASESDSSFSKYRPSLLKQKEPTAVPTAPESPTSLEHKSPAPKVRKSVAFAEGTKDEVSTTRTPANGRAVPPSNGSRVETGNPDTKAFIPHIPANESPEDAALRREMLQYSLNEVGTVVAEMNIDYNSDSDDDESIRSSSDSDGNEDRFGRSQNRVLNDEYVKEMRALEKKLNATSLENIGPGGMVQTLLEAEDNLAAQSSGAQINSNHVPPGGDRNKKEVHSKEVLDGQRRPEELQKALHSDERSVQGNRPVHTDIVERRAPTENVVEANTAPAPGKRASRFKASRRDGVRDASSVAHIPSTMPISNVASNKASLAGSSSPVGRTHAGQVVEHHWTGEGDTSGAPEPDGWDDSIMQQELSEEYHRMRKRMIPQAAGSAASNEAARREGRDEEDDEPLVDEQGKRISRFKADRLGRIR